MRNYLSRIWAARYFWLHLARAELKYKFRGSRLGLLWTMLNPLILMLMITFIFGNLFNIPMTDFAPYVFSGIVIWQFIQGTALNGCNSLLVSQAYIKQFPHPMVIYPLKTTLVELATFLIASLGLFLWMLVSDPANLGLTLLTLPITVLCLALLGWPLAILTATINLKYRDFAQILVIVLQLVWYMSPVFFRVDMFKTPQLIALLEYNPITHILNLVRAPLLNGVLPSAVDFAYVFVCILILSLLAIWHMRRVERTLIYYF
ncbi:MAG: lipopolysaccharide transport system permease protein [Chloroflexota bacterium]|nr:lipopolysaccharide transport system permease protein [Chloroflexota bacterium]